MVIRNMKSIYPYIIGACLTVTALSQVARAEGECDQTSHAERTISILGLKKDTYCDKDPGVAYRLVLRHVCEDLCEENLPADCHNVSHSEYDEDSTEPMNWKLYKHEVATNSWCVTGVGEFRCFCTFKCGRSKSNQVCIDEYSTDEFNIE